ncbi:MAG: hypothetical protein ACXV79_15705 [Methylobacter sp.]
MMSSEKFIAVALVSLAGPFIWVLHFAIVYGAQHFLCVLLGSSADFWIETSIIAITVVALSVLALLIAKPDLSRRLYNSQAGHEFFSGAMRMLAVLAFFGVLWSGIALFFLPTCGSVA